MARSRSELDPWQPQLRSTIMNATPVRSIVVGIDGSGLGAGRGPCAAREASVGQSPIRLVYAFGWMPVQDADDPV